MPGFLLNFNTAEDFKSADKNLLLSRAAAQIWTDIKSGEAVSDPTKLNTVLLLSFADLKKFRYVYW